MYTDIPSPMNLIDGACRLAVRHRDGLNPTVRRENMKTGSVIKRIALLMMVAALGFAMVACQGAVGPAGKDGKDGKPGADGERGTDGEDGERGPMGYSALLSKPHMMGQFDILVNDGEDQDNLPTIGPGGTVNAADLFVGGYGEVTYKIAVTSGTQDAFSVENEGATITYTPTKAARVAAADDTVDQYGYETDGDTATNGDQPDGVRVTVTATDEVGLKQTSSFVIRRNEKPEVNQSGGNGAHAMTVGTQGAIAKDAMGKNLVGCAAAYNVACVSVSAIGGVTDEQIGDLTTTTPLLPPASYNLHEMYSFVTYTGNPAVQVSTGAKGELAIRGVATPMKAGTVQTTGDPPVFDPVVNIKVRAVDPGGLESAPIAVQVTVDPAPTVRFALNGGRPMTVKAEVTETIGNLPSFFSDYSRPNVTLTYTATVEPDEPDHLDATVATVDQDLQLQLKGKSQSSTPITVTVTATETGGNPVLGQSVSQELIVNVVEGDGPAPPSP